MISERPRLTVAVIGAGPAGLSAAAQLVARGYAPLVFEAGERVAAHLDSVRHVRLFSPWQYNLDREAVRLLERAGWQAPAPQLLPTAGELIDQYLAPLSRVPEIAAGLRLGRRVTAVARAGLDKVRTAGREAAEFLIRSRDAGGEHEDRAWAVIDASGTWGQPNPLGASGLPALGEIEHAAAIAYGMPDIAGRDLALYAGKRTLVVGAGHSALGNLLALGEVAAQAPDTGIVWAIRGESLARILGGGEADGLPARGALGGALRALLDRGVIELRSGFRVAELRSANRTLDVLAADAGVAPICGVERIVCATGSRPNLELARELRLRLDPWLESSEALAPLIDPNEHSCGTVRPHGHRELAHPEARYYAIGAKSYGRAPNFLMATGYEQARSVVAALDGDLAAADQVHLELPETGMCSTDFADTAAAACCR